MKKALSLVLAVVLVFGMTVTAFAAADVVGTLHWANAVATANVGADPTFTTSDDVEFDAAGKATLELTMGNAVLAKCVTGNSTQQLGTWEAVTAKTNVTSTFKRVVLMVKNNAGDPVYSASMKILSATYIPSSTPASSTVELVIQLPNNSLVAGFYDVDNTLDITYNYLAATNASTDATIQETPDVDALDFVKIGTSTDTSTSTSTSDTDSGTEVPTTWRITGIASTPIYNYSFDVKDWDDLRGDMTIKSRALTVDMFDWEYRTTGSKYEDVTNVMLDAYKGATVRSSHLTNVTVRTSNTKNMGGTIDEIKIDGNKVKITTVEYFMKCGSTEGYFDLALAYKGRTNGVKESIVFTIKNEKEEIDEYWTYVDTDDHIYLEATETIRYLEMYAGNNLYVTRGMSKGQKIYCRSDITMSTADEKLFYEYAELDSVYTMRTIGVSAAGTTIQFKDLVDTYFVYDSNYKLIGTTADSKLPWSEKYYLATKKVDLGGAPAVDEAPADVEPTAPGVTDNEGLGGDEAPVVPNANYNPNTGL